MDLECEQGWIHDHESAEFVVHQSTDAASSKAIIKAFPPSSPRQAPADALADGEPCQCFQVPYCSKGDTQSKIQDSMLLLLLLIMVIMIIKATRDTSASISMPPVPRHPKA